MTDHEKAWHEHLIWMRNADQLLIELGRHAERVDQLKREIDEALGIGEKRNVTTQASRRTQRITPANMGGTNQAAKAESLRRGKRSSG